MSDDVKNKETAALSVHGINKHFGALHVASDINLTLARGDRHALIGPNGAGKTTFVNLITGALQPDAGTVHLAGQDVTSLSQAARARLGLGRTYQINQLFRELTVLENVCMAITERKAPGLGLFEKLFKPLGAHRDIVDEGLHLLERFRLVDDAQTRIRELAYGRQRLVEMVIALGQEPSVLLLDEPAAGVASSESELILEAVASLDDDVAVLIIEHDMDVVFRFADRITVLVSGEILLEGTPQEISTDPRVREVYLGKAA